MQSNQEPFINLKRVRTGAIQLLGLPRYEWYGKKGLGSS